jgi:hypothetical protein
MLRLVLAAGLVLTAATAYAQFNRCGPGICPNGIFGPAFSTSGSSIPAVTNFRVTNTGDQRVTSAGDSRVISP